MKITLIANNNGSLLKLCYTTEKVISIGRDVGNTIAPLSTEGLSRQHAKIFEKDGKWFLEDLGSTNGTYRLGQKVEGAVELAARDMLQFGKFIISVDEIGDDAPAAPVTAAEPPAAAPALEPVKPSAPAAAPAADESAKPAAPAPALEPVTPAAPVSAPTAALRRPVLPSMKPGLKLPPKPGLGAGLKLPPKPGLAAGLKLPPKPGIAPGLKLPPKTPAAPADGVAELTPVEPLTPVQ